MIYIINYIHTYMQKKYIYIYMRKRKYRKNVNNYGIQVADIWWFTALFCQIVYILGNCHTKCCRNTFICVFYVFFLLQTYLRDIVGLVLDHCSKANIELNWVKWVFFCFPVHIKVMLRLYCRPLSVQQQYV